jgi:hypothetical protein
MSRPLSDRVVPCHSGQHWQAAGPGRAPRGPQGKATELAQSALRAVFAATFTHPNYYYFFFFLGSDGVLHIQQRPGSLRSSTMPMVSCLYFSRLKRRVLQASPIEHSSPVSRAASFRAVSVAMVLAR